MKKQCIDVGRLKLVTCSNNPFGKKVKKLYLVVETEFPCIQRQIDSHSNSYDEDKN